ncbi:MAG: Gfo/Idh/MocA family oxidoreductase [Crocinitomicaceae bacterium]|jgi:predicted dehydrogenase|nr:Gfo/Idh/MocA family oxidoreductase [Crocinitomicaceae bacterium]MDP4683870.1 Gfo/Idh/MocA family oxidoreductase [Crocinitomicaceae bacterium]MDP4865839.1 Gfo/Idh/MocA family oxidoreductase [Crocinitomicaceae bacterium]MDP5011060.1 Gfo/Idh/MocA family oxidoreductase [Crocinitomicaceae bacterium]MDP5099550.1 Gfo/Idh/MocA family oxidoreductase [Crocinitomicaceae bacterium]
MLKVGVLGAGHLGKIHIRLLLELTDYFEFVGFFDPSDDNAEKAIEQFNIKRFATISELLDAVDCIDIVTPTLSHFDCASQALRKSKHVFIEKPVTETVDEARILMGLAREANVKVQVGHVERFNPAFQAALPYFNKPMFIETHRLAQFNPRGTDVPVVLDLMIHDLDIILSVVKSGIKRISASGVAVVSDTHDITNARIEFDNGCVANLTASRISLKNMRKSRFFQKDAYISVDFLTKELEVVRMEDVVGEADPLDIVFDLGAGKPVKKIFFDKPEIGEVNAIKEELRTFAEAIIEDKMPIVPIEDGYRALDVAQQILDKLKVSTNISIDNNI